VVSAHNRLAELGARGVDDDGGPHDIPEWVDGEMTGREIARIGLGLVRQACVGQLQLGVGAVKAITGEHAEGRAVLKVEILRRDMKTGGVLRPLDEGSRLAEMRAHVQEISSHEPVSLRQRAIDARTGADPNVRLGIGDAGRLVGESNDAFRAVTRIGRQRQLRGCACWSTWRRSRARRQADESGNNNRGSDSKPCHELCRSRLQSLSSTSSRC
jgi:hypothetical protein